jgi:hypothetical protein
VFSPDRRVDYPLFAVFKDLSTCSGYDGTVNADQIRAVLLDVFDGRVDKISDLERVANVNYIKRLIYIKRLNVPGVAFIVVLQNLQKSLTDISHPND